MRQFTVDGQTIRFALHHTGTDADLDGFIPDVESIVAVERDIFGEFPSYEPDTYTFLADYLPYASGDGMEHRNSTVITSPSVDRAPITEGCSTPSRMSFSTAGTSSGSARSRSSRSTSSGSTCQASCGSPKASRSTTGRSR